MIPVWRISWWVFLVGFLVWIGGLAWLNYTEIADFYDPNGPYPIQPDGTRANIELWPGWQGLAVTDVVYGLAPALLAAGLRWSLLRRRRTVQAKEREDA